MSKLARFVIILTLLGCLSIINWSIYTNEKQLSSGAVVYLKLAPVDPRSLMQGDYMALRFEMANDIRAALSNSADVIRMPNAEIAADGHVIVETDDNNIASFVAIYSRQVLQEDQLLLQFRIRNGDVKFATNAFFFQEGHAKRYEPAEYGLFRVDKQGKLLLVSLHDSALKNLSAKETQPL